MAQQQDRMVQRIREYVKDANELHDDLMELDASQTEARLAHTVRELQIRVEEQQAALEKVWMSIYVFQKVLSANKVSFERSRMSTSNLQHMLLQIHTKSFDSFSLSKTRISGSHQLRHFFQSRAPYFQRFWPHALSSRMFRTPRTPYPARKARLPKQTQPYVTRRPT